MFLCRALRAAAPRRARDFGVMRDIIMLQDYSIKGVDTPQGTLSAVKGGYLRNFLMPRGIAVLATPKNREKYLTGDAFADVQQLFKDLDAPADALEGALEADLLDADLLAADGAADGEADGADATDALALLDEAGEVVVAPPPKYHTPPSPLHTITPVARTPYLDVSHLMAAAAAERIKLEKHKAFVATKMTHVEEMEKYLRDQGEK
ncbi:hypothetical protein M885DRAFT_578406 [Pelagophyceae sp. CCMP2097]|nr:hypothetical protein M885DRAFT_578406 [Pelagophyceae sp. CCMP2097]|mmetsp:Transcript_31260/g.105164  ORF Transcript_31260/g.105164 Transcript_31260/m.105164 type:complete len:207 (-) Transcript_31260:20-640(-)